jgi:hypothetical protein
MYCTDAITLMNGIKSTTSSRLKKKKKMYMIFSYFRSSSTAASPYAPPPRLLPSSSYSVTGVLTYKVIDRSPLIWGGQTTSLAKEVVQLPTLLDYGEKLTNCLNKKTRTKKRPPSFHQSIYIYIYIYIYCFFIIVAFTR